jgi:hypothetical protein
MSHLFHKVLEELTFSDSDCPDKISDENEKRVLLIMSLFEELAEIA